MKFITALCALLFLSTPAFAQEALPPAVDDGRPAATGKVYFIRHTGYEGSAVAFKTVIDGEVACKLRNKRYSIHEVAPGAHGFTVQFSGKQSDPVQINVEAGKTYYVYMILQNGVARTALYCVELTENSAQKFLAECTPDTECG